MKPVLAFITKAPAMGRSKTRLARDIGPVRAWSVKRTLDRRALRLAHDPHWISLLYVADQRDLGRPVPTVWPSPKQLARRWQGTGGLGPRLIRACRDAARSGRGVLLVGTDCPAMGCDDLRLAARLVQSGQVVAGPASDGGFWLLGLPRALAARVQFQGVRWSTATTLADTLSSLPLRRAPMLLRTLDDIDTGADLVAWRVGFPGKA